MGQVVDITATALFGLASVAGAVMVGRMWTGVDYFGDDPGSWWPSSPMLWRGLRRALPAVVAAMACGAVASAALFFEPGSIAYEVGAWLAVLGFVLCGVAVSVAVANRPRCLIPPPLRSEPSFLDEQRSSRSKS